MGRQSITSDTRDAVTRHIHRTFAFLLALACLAVITTQAQAQAQAQGQGQSAPPAAEYSQDLLDSLLAPVALYPDELLAQVLMASTYPLDVVAAARFVQANRGLKGDALAQAIEGKNWDPSVISLTGFPQVLEMMNDKLDWMQQLGDAFLADEATVLRTVQGLRAKAQAAGNLKSTEQQKVVVEDRTIVIEPAQPRYVYVPVYNPVYVYGPWWAPYYPPWYWAPPAMYYPGAVIVGGTIGFGIGWVIGGHHWGWCRPSWGGNHIHININRRPRPELRGGVSGDGKWQHRPEQRKGVAYRDAATRDRYQKIDQNAVAARRDYRDYRGSNSPGAPGALQRPSTMDRPGPIGPSGPATMDRPAPIGPSGPATMDRPSPIGPSGPSTMDRPVPVGPSGPSAMDRPYGMGSRPPSTFDRPGGMTPPRPSPMDRPGGSVYPRPPPMNRPENITPGRPADRSWGGGGRPAPSINPGHSFGQAQQFSNRGAHSRSSMGGGGRGGGSGAGAGGGGRRR